MRRAGRHTQPSALALGGAGFAGSGFFFCDEGVAEDELAGRFGIFLALRVEEGGRRAAVASEVLLRDERRAAALLVALLERFLRGRAAEERRRGYGCLLSTRVLSSTQRVVVASAGQVPDARLAAAPAQDGRNGR